MCYVAPFGSLPCYYVFSALRIVITATVACVCGGLLCVCDGLQLDWPYDTGVPGVNLPPSLGPNSLFLK